VQTDVWWQGFLTALRLLTRLPVAGENSSDTRSVLAAFPVVGALVGLALWGSGSLLLHGIGSPLAAALLCAILLPPLYWWFCGARNLRGLVWVVSNWVHEEAGDDDEAEGQYRPYAVLLAVQTVLLCRVFCFGALVYHGAALWLAVGPVLAFTVHAELLERQLGDAAESSRWPVHWTVAAVLVLAAAAVLKGLLVGVLALVLSWVLSGALPRLVDGNCGRFDENSHGAVREAAELLCLLAGILYFLSRG
jgi:cobalamin synthase